MSMYYFTLRIVHTPFSAHISVLEHLSIRFSLYYDRKVLKSSFLARLALTGRGDTLL